MRIKLLSDLHHEWMTSREQKAQGYFDYNGEDVLVLAGDIASGSTNVYDSIKAFKKAGFPEVVYVPGNHEYYGTSIRDFNAKMAIKTLQDDATHFLNPGFAQIGDVTFIGATLWTNFRGSVSDAMDAGRGITDFRLIDGFHPSHCESMFREHFQYIKHMYEQRATEKVVIVTHFLPAVECISPRFQDPTNSLNSYFANDLGEWIETLDNTTWLFGHTHDSIDITIGTTRLVANPYGYWGNEVNPTFANQFVIEV